MHRGFLNEASPQSFAGGRPARSYNTLISSSLCISVTLRTNWSSSASRAPFEPPRPWSFRCNRRRRFRRRFDIPLARHVSYVSHVGLHRQAAASTSRPGTPAHRRRRVTMRRHGCRRRPHRSAAGRPVDDPRTATVCSDVVLTGHASTVKGDGVLPLLTTA